ncbi:MAG: hypothetical protein ACRERU_15170 [Methylococcales bacterium]
MKNRLLCIVLTILVVTSGCASEKKKDSLESTLRLYERSIKWGSYADAQTLTAKPEAQERLDRYNEIKVISYEVLRQEIVGDFEQINQIVDIKFYHEQQGKIETVRDTQVWIYNQDRESWVLQTGLPDFMSVVR